MGAGGRHEGGSPLSPVSRLGQRRLSPGPPSLHRGRAQNRLPEVGSQAATEPRGSSFPPGQGTRPGCPEPGSPGMHKTGVGASSQPPDPQLGSRPQATPGPLTRPRSEWPGVWNSAAGLAPRAPPRAPGGRGQGCWRQGGVEAGAARDQGHWTADPARPARKANSNAAHPTGAQPGRPSHADTKQGQALGPRELHRDRSPGRMEPRPLPKGGRP